MSYLNPVLPIDSTPLLSVQIQDPLVNLPLEAKTNEVAKEIIESSTQAISNEFLLWDRRKKVSLFAAGITTIAGLVFFILGIVPPISGILVSVGAVMMVGGPGILGGLAAYIEKCKLNEEIQKTPSITIEEQFMEPSNDAFEVMKKED
jgi:hypothetical protein